MIEGNDSKNESAAAEDANGQRDLEWHRVLTLDDAIRRALDHDGPALVEVVADAELV